MNNLLLKLLPPIFAAILAIPIYLIFFDREPPFVRLYGSIVPEEVQMPPLPKAGQKPKQIHIAVRYVVTKRNQNRNCPGTLQQEFVDSEGTQISKAVREVGPAKWEDHPTNPNYEIFYGHPVSVPIGLLPGRIRFRTATFRFCNFLQKWLHLPIIQRGPDLYFTLTAPERPKQ